MAVLVVVAVLVLVEKSAMTTGIVRGTSRAGDDDVQDDEEPNFYTMPSLSSSLTQATATYKKGGFSLQNAMSTRNLNTLPFGFSMRTIDALDSDTPFTARWSEKGTIATIKAPRSACRPQEEDQYPSSGTSIALFIPIIAPFLFARATF